LIRKHSFAISGHSFKTFLVSFKLLKKRKEVLLFVDWKFLSSLQNSFLNIPLLLVTKKLNLFSFHFQTDVKDFECFLVQSLRKGSLNQNFFLCLLCSLLIKTICTKKFDSKRFRHEKRVSTHEIFKTFCLLSFSKFPVRIPYVRVSKTWSYTLKRNYCINLVYCKGL